MFSVGVMHAKRRYTFNGKFMKQFNEIHQKEVGEKRPPMHGFPD
jgi:hypothetical protein